MDEQQFDELTRRFASATSRRRVLGALAGGMLGAVGLRHGSAATCREAGRRCAQHADCCSTICDPAAKICVCPPGQENCHGLCKTQADYQADALNCGGCGSRCPRTLCSIAVCNQGHCGLASDPAMRNRPCDDGNRCTVADVCQANGSCAGSTKDCSGQNDQCNDGVCRQSDGACIKQPKLNGIGCNADSNACTVNDTCQNGTCTVGSLKDCSSLNDSCNDGVCDPATGNCRKQPKTNGTGCNDGKACTVDDVCTNGVCAGVSKNCSSLDDVCNTGVCRQSDGVCIKQPRANGTECNADNNSCTVGDSCQSGVCTPGMGTNCASAADQCNDGVCNPQTGGCEKRPKMNGTGCNADSNACTENDACQQGICTAGPPKSCPVCQACSGGTCQPIATDARCMTDCCGGSCCPPLPANATRMCGGAMCSFTCNSGFSRCGSGCCSTTLVCCNEACCAPGQTCNGTQCVSPTTTTSTTTSTTTTTPPPTCVALGAVCNPASSVCCRDNPSAVVACEDVVSCGGAGVPQCCHQPGSPCSNTCNCCGQSLCEGHQCCSYPGGDCVTADDCCSSFTGQACVDGTCCVQDGFGSEAPEQCCSGVSDLDGTCAACTGLGNACDDEHPCCSSVTDPAICQATCDFDQAVCCHGSGGSCFDSCDCCGANTCVDNTCCEAEMCSGQLQCCIPVGDPCVPLEGDGRCCCDAAALCEPRPGQTAVCCAGFAHPQCSTADECCFGRRCEDGMCCTWSPDQLCDRANPTSCCGTAVCHDDSHCCQPGGTACGPAVGLLNCCPGFACAGDICQPI